MFDLKSENIGTYLKRRIDSFEKKEVISRYGTVTRANDGVVRIDNLPGREYGELLEFGEGVFGMVMDLEENGVGAVLFDAADRVGVGCRVRGLGVVSEVPVGESLVGRVIDPLGRAYEGEQIKSNEYLPSERPAHPLIERRPVNVPLMTGIISIDSMIPIGRGQRELIIGDRQTGKTSLALSAILNQKDTGVICIYCAIGQKAANIAQIIQTLTVSGAIGHSIVVAATASDSPAMQYLAPYSACSIAEYFMERGKDVLVVYDDLSKHAVAYRTMSLLLHRPPGREAYPGDVFYLHSRLLERAAALDEKYGGGSITALPIVETMGGNISSYIPTNVISITDGQIFLESELFFNGFRPAVNTGLSVSRVGRAAQPKAMRKLSGNLRIELSQYREMAVFSRFGADIDQMTKKALDRGECLSAIFVQSKSTLYSLSSMSLLLLAFNEDIFTGIDISRLSELLKSLIDGAGINCPGALEEIDNTRDLSDDAREKILSYLRNWRKEVDNKT